VARIHELLSQLRNTNPSLAKDIEREYSVVAERRAFGLNFERHTPEAVELPGRQVRVGDKVRILPPRGNVGSFADRSLYRVVSFNLSGDERIAVLVPIIEAAPGVDPKEVITAPVADLVVVAEFSDPIYPGLVSSGTVERSSDKPFHSIINGENFHALQTLLFTHRGRVDAIYIDPPYNTGAKDWKYNNDYVESDDLYRHSKWLAFMERRLLLARELLNPEDSALIVTIDEKEYLRLGLLLEQIFPDAKIQMVTTVIKPEGTGRTNEFSRTNEFLFYVMIGDYKLSSTPDNMVETNVSVESEDLLGVFSEPSGPAIEWRNLRRRERESVRGARPSQFYAVFIDQSSGLIHSVGDVLSDDIDRGSVTVPMGCKAEFPLAPDGREMLWGVIPERLRSLVANGYARYNGQIVQFLNSGTVDSIGEGLIQVSGRDQFGGVIGIFDEGAKRFMPKTLCVKASHNSQASGSLLLKKFIGARKFPFPKALYAVEDALRFVVLDKPSATIIDFFSGSGTTAHAVMRLNRQDGGQRVSISVTNNEVSADEHKKLRALGHRPGDGEWEQWGICEFITKPRIRAAVEGMSEDGNPIRGDYRFKDVFPMQDGFEENVEFFTLTYEAPMRVQSNREFERIAPFLWLRAGSRGRRLDTLPEGWGVVETYGVLADLDHTDEFIVAMTTNEDAKLAFIITDEDRLFEAVVRDLPAEVEPVRMYASYLRNFEIDAMRSVR
jgi:adenine-specific DNA-methyltransferase